MNKLMVNGGGRRALAATWKNDAKDLNMAARARRPPEEQTTDMRMRWWKAPHGIIMNDSSADFSAMPSPRKRPAHMPLVETGNKAIIVFLTVCTKERRRILAKPDVHDLLVDSWRCASQWAVGRYVIMPDHIHLFCAPAVNSVEPVKSWVRFWKAHSSRKWPRHEEQPIWQPDMWDTQLRKGERYGEKWEYVRNNPVRDTLSDTPEDWPYQGEIVSLPWHDE